MARPMRNRTVNEHSLALAREWKKLGRAATAVALLTSPIVFAVFVVSFARPAPWVSTRLSIRKRGSSGGHHQAMEIDERFADWRSDPGRQGVPGAPIAGGALSAPPAGLCAACAHQKLVRTGRGSVFSMCLRARSDPRYAKYPRLPVLRCPGFERVRSGGDPGAPAPRGAP